jgi:predicted polyphosphate/ATP-dependent NAD kinase
MGDQYSAVPSSEPASFDSVIEEYVDEEYRWLAAAVADLGSHVNRLLCSWPVTFLQFQVYSLQVEVRILLVKQDG